MRRYLLLAAILMLYISSSANAQSMPRNLKPRATAHSVTLSWTASSTPGVSYNIYRGAAKIANVSAVTYVDGTVAAATTYTYSVSSLCVTCVAPITGESSHLNTVSITTPTDVPPPPPPSCTAIAVNCRIKVTSTANIRTTPVSATVLPAMIGSEPAGALGTILAVDTFGYAPLGSFKWVEVKFDTCSSSIPSCTGWMGSDNMTVVGTVIPPPPPTPTVIFTCIPTLNTLTCTGKLTAVPVGSPYTVNATIDGLNVAASGTTK